MSEKVKITPEQKIKACTDYLSGKKSVVMIAKELNLTKYGKEVVRRWTKMYEAWGTSAFEKNPQNRSYSPDFKEKIVGEYLEGTISMSDLSLKYRIPSPETIRKWILMYNNHIELKDYDPKPEVYMKDTLKTTYEERIEIVKYCLANERDIKGTAAKYGCKYAQLYQWIRKYEDGGEEALLDKRGRRKTNEELSELEKAERRIAQLEREKEEYRKKYELLKKVEQFERW